MKNILKLLILVLLFSAYSCKKEPKDYEKSSDDKTNALLTLQKGINGRQNLTVFPHNGNRTTQIAVNYGGLGVPASDIDINIEVDQTAFDSINNVREQTGLAPFLKFPAGSYSLDNPSIKIPSGKINSNYSTLTYNSDAFALDKQYLIVFKVSNNSGYKFANGVTRVEFVAAVNEKEHPKTGWVATASSEHPGENTGLASALIDNNLATYWHSKYSAVAAVYPHEASIVFPKELYTTKISLHKRQAANNTWFKIFDLYGTTDGTTWKLIGENLVTVAAELGPQFYPITPQYLKGVKLVMKSGHTTAQTTHLAEISVFGY